MDGIPHGNIDGLTGEFDLTPVAIDTWGTNYMDALNCAVTTANVYWKYTCVGWQVDWDPRPTDRYPRFGLNEKLWAGAIDSTLTTEAVWTEVKLNGAFSSIVAGLAGAAAMLMSF